MLIKSTQELADYLRSKGAPVDTQNYGNMTMYLLWPCRVLMTLTSGSVKIGEVMVSGDVYIPPVQNVEVCDPIIIYDVNVITPFPP